jgi:hypothetical protein
MSVWKQFWLLKLPTAALRKWKRHAMNVERILREYGQFLRPLSEAPRDGRKVLGQSAKGMVLCYWDATPSKLAGPSWVEHEGAERGYLDRYFTGWLDLRNFKMLDYAALARLLIAYIDDARAVDDKEALKILNLHAN